MNMTNKVLLILAIVIIFIIAGYFIGYESDKDTVKVGISVTEPIINSFLIIAQEKGIFEKNNIDVDLVPFSNGGEIKQALSTGHLDFGRSGMVNFLIAITKGAPVKVISPSSFAYINLYVNPESNITKFKDLEGKTIASRVGGTTNLIISSILRKENVDLSTINFIDIEDKFRPLALMEKETIDAGIGTSTNEDNYEKIGAIVLPEWVEKGYLDGEKEDSNIKGVIGVNTEFLEKNPEKVEAFIDSIIEAHRFIKENQDESAKIIEEYASKTSEEIIKLNVEEIKKMWTEKRQKLVLWYEPESLLTVANAAKDVDVIDRVPEIEEIYDLRFKEKLKSAQEEIYEN